MQLESFLEGCTRTDMDEILPLFVAGQRSSGTPH